MEPFLADFEEDAKEYEGKDGYSQDLFVEQPKEDFICVLCAGVVRAPLECMNCGLLMCRKCIGYYLKSRHQRGPLGSEFSCPQCRFKAAPRAPSKLLLTLISELVVRCKYQELGCTVTMPLSTVKTHQKECMYRDIKCAYCGVKGDRESFISAENRYLCSPPCLRTWHFSSLVRSQKTDEALRMYYELLLEKTHKSSTSP